MLPDGFKWTKASPLDTIPTTISLGGIGVCRMMDRADKSWFVYLDYHLPPLNGQLVHRKRDCSSFPKGVRGCELWVAKHEARLRVEVAARELEWRRSRGLI